MKQTIKVTETDIKQGKCQDALRCPVALAALRAGFIDPGVTRLDLSYGDGAAWRCLSLPGEARRFVRAFDLGETVQPFEFEVTV